MRSKLDLCCLLLIISGLFGFVYEVIFYFFNGGMKQFYWRGANFLPWIDIYALGSLLILLTTYKMTKYPLKIFLISCIICGSLEYLSGLLIYIIRDGYRAWDYNKEILNFGSINGFICLRSVLFFGISSLVLMYIFVPICKKLIKIKWFMNMSYILLAIIFIDEFYNLLIARVTKLPRAYDIYKKIGIHFVKFK